MRVDLRTSRALLTYPPLPNGAPESFDLVIKSVLELLRSRGLVPTALPVRHCLSSLLKGGARRVAVSRGEFDTKDAKFQITSLSRKQSIETSLAGLISDSADAASGSRRNVERQIKNSLEHQTFQMVTLSWIDEDLRTRVKFIESGAEFLFFWGESGDRTFARVDSVVGLLFDLSEGLRSADFKTVWESIGTLADGTIVTPGEFASRFKVDPKVVQGAIIDAVNAGLLEPVYRLVAPQDLLEQHSLLSWTTDLVSLRRVFEAGNVEVDGADARNVGIGFRRTYHSSVAEDR
jgi:hypothetical protein